MSDENVQRSLGRIEGTQTQILDALQKLTESFSEHKNEDQRNFSSVRNLVYSELKKNDESREKHLSEQDEKLDSLKQDADRAKGAGWVILGLIGALATFAGGAVLAVLTGWISIKFH